MLTYKTRCVPAVALGGIRKKEFYNGLTPETANAAVAEVDYVIQEESRQGWTLHSVNTLTKRLVRKKTIWEKLFSWIPLIGGWIFKNLDETTIGVNTDMYLITFVKEG